VDQADGAAGLGDDEAVEHLLQLVGDGLARSRAVAWLTMTRTVCRCCCPPAFIVALGVGEQRSAGGGDHQHFRSTLEQHDVRKMPAPVSSSTTS